MSHHLFEQINEFHQWSKAYDDTPEDERGGEWECSYHNWRQIWNLFEEFLNTSNPSAWDDETKKDLLYIIARDNECESLSGILGKHQKALKVLAYSASAIGQRNSKWQIAVQLKHLDDKLEAEKFLEKFVQDKDEYVSRMSLMTLADIGSAKTEHYCQIAWNKDIREQEWQRMAVLYSLDKILSPLLSLYLVLAKQDGREGLLYNVDLIEKKHSV